MGGGATATAQIKMDSITEGFESQDIESTLRTAKHDSGGGVTPQNKSMTSGSHRLFEQKQLEMVDEPNDKQVADDKATTGH